MCPISIFLCVLLLSIKCFVYVLTKQFLSETAEREAGKIRILDLHIAVLETNSDILILLIINDL